MKCMVSIESSLRSGSEVWQFDISVHCCATLHCVNAVSHTDFFVLESLVAP